LFLFIDIITARTAVLIIIPTTYFVQGVTFLKPPRKYVLLQKKDKNIKLYFLPLISGEFYLSEFLFLFFIQRVSGFFVIVYS